MRRALCTAVALTAMICVPQVSRSAEFTPVSKALYSANAQSVEVQPVQYANRYGYRTPYNSYRYPSYGYRYGYRYPTYYRNYGYGNPSYGYGYGSPRYGSGYRYGSRPGVSFGFRF